MVRKDTGEIMKRRKILKRPYGLPSWVKLTDYLSQTVCFLSSYNYKLEAQVGLDDKLKAVLTVMDTGAGPNIIRYDIVPAEARAKIDTSIDTVNLASASNHRLETVGVVNLVVQVGLYRVKQPFIVTRQLGADAILGCTFIDTHVEAIFPRRRYAVLANGEEINIRRRATTRPTETTTKESIQVEGQAVKPDAVVRMAHSITLSPFSETYVEATSQVSGTHMLEPRPELYSRKQLTMSNGITDIQPNVPF